MLTLIITDPMALPYSVPRILEPRAISLLLISITVLPNRLLARYHPPLALHQCSMTQPQSPR